MILNEDQSNAFKKVLEGKNVFITGPGGVGKSVLINKIMETMEDSTIFCAPTGVAAQNIKGSTVHSLFGFDIGYLNAYRRNRVNPKAEAVLSSHNLKRIVLDEASMNRAEVFEAMNKACQLARRSKKAFGGLQFVGVGDFYQLSPVFNKNSQEGQMLLSEFDSQYAFDTPAWKDAGLETIQLNKIMRQNDEGMINALNSIRRKDKDWQQALAQLNAWGKKSIDESDMPIFLCSTNKDADMINDDMYADVDGVERLYTGRINGTFKDPAVPINLALKVGVKVLIAANNAELGYFNGQTGIVEYMTDKEIGVRVDQTNELVGVEKFTWSQYEYAPGGPSGFEKNVVGTFSQFPLKLGYAVTIHKSQGMSLSRAVIYTGRGCFAHGQAYVAFSRLRSKEGLHLINPIGTGEIIVDPRVTQFYNGELHRNLLS